MTDELVEHPEFPNFEDFQLRDERNLKYLVVDAIPNALGDVRTIWPAAKRALSQRDTPHCGSFAWATLYTSTAMGDRDVTRGAGFAFGEALFDEIFKWIYDRELHSAICALGAWGKHYGYIEDYRWATTMEEFRDGIVNLGPAAVAVPWPWPELREGPKGHLSLRPDSFVPDQGHMLCVRGYDPDKSLPAFGKVPAYKGPAFLMRNSWGPGWMMNGDCWISWHDLEILLNAGDPMEYSACIPTKRLKKLIVRDVFANGELERP